MPLKSDLGINTPVSRSFGFNTRETVAEANTCAGFYLVLQKKR